MRKILFLQEGAISGALVMALLSGCAAGMMGATLDKYQGRWFRVVHGNLGERRLSIEMNYDVTIRHFIESHGRPDYIYVRDLRNVIALYIERDLAVFFRRGVLGAKSEAVLREGISEPLIAEAMKVKREVDDGQHLIYLLLEDQEAVLRPPGSALWTEGTEKAVQSSIESGWDFDYPDLRIQQYIIPLDAAEAEAFFRQTWPTFRFLGLKKEKLDDATISNYVQWFRWRRGKLQPASKEKDIPDQPQEGIRLALTEFRNLKDHQPFPIPVGEVFCIILVRNYRQIGSRRGE